MRKYIIGAIIGGIVMAGGTFAFAATRGGSGISIVDQTSYITKFYDSDADIICYTYYSTGISCVHHN